MKDALFIIAAVAAIPCGGLALVLLDRWHQRRAWREADRRAQDILRRKRGTP